MSNRLDWDDTVQLIVDVLKKHKVIMRDDVMFDLQAKESLAADIIEKLDDLWSKNTKDTRRLKIPNSDPQKLSSASHSNNELPLYSIAANSEELMTIKRALDISNLSTFTKEGILKAAIAYALQRSKEAEIATLGRLARTGEFDGHQLNVIHDMIAELTKKRGAV